MSESEEKDFPEDEQDSAEPAEEGDAGKKKGLDELIDMPAAIDLLKTTRATFYRWLRAGNRHHLGRRRRLRVARVHKQLR